MLSRVFRSPHGLLSQVGVPARSFGVRRGEKFPIQPHSKLLVKAKSASTLCAVLSVFFFS